MTTGTRRRALLAVLLIAAGVLLSIIISASSPLSFPTVLRAVFGFAAFLLLPGFAWSLVLLPGNALSPLERLLVSFGLSVGIMPVLLYATSKLGIAVSPLSILMQLLVVSSAAGAVLFFRRHRPEA